MGDTLCRHESLHLNVVPVGDDCRIKIGGAAAQILKSPAVSANSTLAVLALGDLNTANEPQQLAVYSTPTSRKVIEGRKAIARRQVDLLKDVLSRCRIARPTSISPIFLDEA